MIKAHYEYGFFFANKTSVEKIKEEEFGGI